MVRRRRLLRVLAVLAAGLGLVWWQAPGALEQRLERDLSRLFGRAVEVGRVELALFPLEIEIHDLRVAGAAPGSPPFLEVRRANVVPAFRRLWSEGRIALWAVTLEAPTVRIRTYAQRGDDLPKLNTGGGGGAELDIRRLVIEEGELVLDEQKVPFRLDLPGLRGRLSTPAGGGLAGQLQLGPGPIRFGSAPPMPLQADLDLLLRGKNLTVRSARLQAPATDVRATGEVVVKPLSARLSASGPVDLRLADVHVLRTAFGLQGEAVYRGTATLDKGKMRFEGHLEGTKGVFDGQAVPRYAGRVSWGPEGTRLRDFEVEALGGTARLQVDVPPAPGRAQVKGPLRAVDAEGLARYVFGWGPLELGASATGSIDVSWPRGQGARHVSGEVEMALAERVDRRRTPLSGHLRWRAHDGRQTIAQATFVTPHTSVEVKGDIDPRRRADLTLSGDTTDLARADDLGVTLRKAVGARRAEPALVAGRGSFSGHWGGTLDEPVVAGRFVGDDFAYLGVRWGEVDWTGRITTSTFTSTPALLRRGAARLRLEGTSFTGATRRDDHVDLRARFESWPARDLRVALESDVMLEGDLTGEARVTGTALEPWGTSSVRAASGTWYGVPFTSLDVQSDLLGPVLRVSEGHVVVGGGPVAFHGTVDSADVYDGEAEMQGVSLDALAGALLPGQPWGGRVSGRARLQGTVLRPRLQAELRSPRVFHAEEGVGALELRLRGEGDGLVSVTGDLRSGRVQLGVEGRVGAEAPYVADLMVSARDTSVDPFLRTAVPSLPAALGVVVTGTLGVRGPLQDVAALDGQVELERLAFVFPGYPVENAEPVRLSLHGGRVQVDEVRLRGEGTDLALDGSLGIGPEATVDLQLDGAADLRALAPLVPGLRGRGAATLRLDVQGAPRDPRLQGQVELTGAGLRVRGFPHGVESLHGTVAFTERSARFDDLTGTVGGGPVEIAGQATYGPPGLHSFDVRASGRSLALRYPEGLRSLVDAELRLFGDAARRWVTGTVDVRQATWTRRYDVASELLAARDTLPAPVPGAPGVDGGARLDVRLRAPGTLRVDNNLASLRARADLTVRGTSSLPVLLGRAEVDGGRVYFQGNTYVIRRGTIDFSNPQRTDPVFDIEAEARLRSYRITLDVSGTLDRVNPTLSSDPPLSAVQIVSLLAGADEDTVSSLAQGTLASTGGAAGARLAAAGAATLAAGRLSEEVGLERGAERYFGLNRFSIDPTLVRGGVQNPTARLTMGKRVTPDLNVLYSVDLRGNEEHLLSVEYTVSDRFSVLLTRSEPGGLGFDVRLRQSR